MVVAKFDRYDMINNPGCDTAAFTIWFSGCNLRCKNCHNRKLWNSDSGNKYSVQTIARVVKASCNKLGIKYVVLLGGEPLQQSKEELLSLCRLLKEAGLKIWLYTGYEFQDIDRYILKYVDIVKCGKYIDEYQQDGFPASSNQRVYMQDNGDFIDITNNFRR